ncbi:stage V sporulation protein AC [Alkalihalobacillus xiaoxiensis]|uniref:Stage V sporulation protein AC n=1 Tax=Shouchella xiaoxiensis TaxID=766895 RepID=A0ABS2SRS1_9BACI|nr:stage V sporulation protein AC [Shouchella xiaoxiensis]MBM7838223.1 stage V sporulation protein AC [Shouchella xiaoxiensis]
MTNERKALLYKENITLYKPKNRVLKNGFLSFLSGGFICFLGQLIFKGYQHYFLLSDQRATSFMIITLIGLAALATVLGLFKKGAQLFGAGLLVPITGFVNAMTSTALEYRTEGILIGVGSNLFRLVGPILMVGIGAAYIVSFSRLFIQMLLH